MEEGWKENDEEQYPNLRGAESLVSILTGSILTVTIFVKAMANSLTD